MIGAGYSVLYLGLSPERIVVGWLAPGAPIIKCMHLHQVMRGCETASGRSGSYCLALGLIVPSK